MVAKKFFLKSSKDLQRVGLRAQIVSHLIEQGVEKGNAVNDASDRKRVIVVVCAESEKAIEDIKNELVRHLNSLSDIDPDCYGQIPDDITASELRDLNNPNAIAAVDLQKMSASLMLEQTSKGVGAMLSLGHATASLAKSVKTMGTTTSRDIQVTAKSIESLSKGIETMSATMSKDNQATVKSIENLAKAIEPIGRLPRAIESLEKKLP